MARSTTGQATRPAGETGLTLRVGSLVYFHTGYGQLAGVVAGWAASWECYVRAMDGRTYRLAAARLVEV